jgi:hypothetical protein
MSGNIFQYMRPTDQRLDAKKIAEIKSTNGHQTGPDPVTAKAMQLVKTVPKVFRLQQLSGGQQMTLPRVKTGVMTPHFDDKIVQFAGPEARQQQSLIEDVRRLMTDAAARDETLDCQIDSSASFDEVSAGRLGLAVTLQVEKDFFHDAVLVLHFDQISGANVI